MKQRDRIENMCGHPERWMTTALELEPASTIINTNASLISYLAREFDRSVARGEAAGRSLSELWVLEDFLPTNRTNVAAK